MSTPAKVPDQMAPSHLDERAGKFRSVSTRLIGKIVQLAMVVMLAFTSVHVWLEYERSYKEFRQSMTFMAENSRRLLSTAIWDIEPSHMQAEVKWLSELELVAYVNVAVNLSGQEFMGGREVQVRDANDPKNWVRPPDLVMPIFPPANSSALPGEILGTLEIWRDEKYYRTAIWDSTLRVITGYALYTVLICWVVWWVLRKDLRRPLSLIASFAASLKPNELSRPLVIQRPHSQKMDEIDWVIQGFTQLQKDLRHHITTLDRKVEERTQQLSLMVEEVERLSQLDALTGVYNRRVMQTRLPLDIERAQRYGGALSIVFADIDHFKRINDQHGHQVGDEVLKNIAQCLQKSLRTNIDWMVRFGGEEFVIVMPETNAAQAFEAARRLVEVVRDTPWEGQGIVLPLTCSFGVAQYRHGESMESLLERADYLLYQAKRQGRDRVCVLDVA